VEAGWLVSELVEHGESNLYRPTLPARLA